MIFDSTLYYILIFPIAIVFAILLGKLVKLIESNKKDDDTYKPSHYGLFVGIVSGVLGIVILFNLPADLVVLNRDSTVTSYAFIGKITFESNGIEFELEKKDNDDTFIINNTGILLVFEDVEYGEQWFGLDIASFSGDWIDAIEHDSLRSCGSLPDYYPWDSPPDEISVSTGSSGDTREWLRYAKTSEKEHYFNGNDRNTFDQGLNLDVLQLDAMRDLFND
ncbi:MAG: hypothetical protein QNK23_12600 [Crocinitomicaceae bacterium]|nr:hypothetical protein [Crocinitomicaceae bacterium]